MGIEHLLRNTWIYKKVYGIIAKRVVEKNKKCFEENGMSVFKNFVNVMNRNDMKYWLEFGTLLGAIRDKGIIKGDFDFDFGVYLKDAYKIHRLLTEAGFRLVRDFHVVGENGLEQTYEMNGATLDLFFFFEKDGDNDNIYANSFIRYQRKKKGRPTYRYVTEFKFSRFDLVKIDFLGKSVYVPSDSHKHLKEVYGETYMVPDPNFKDGLNKTKFSFEEKRGVGYYIR